MAGRPGPRSPFLPLNRRTPGRDSTPRATVASRRTRLPHVLHGSAYHAQWASAAGVGARIIVASNGPSSAKSILWSAFDVGMTSPVLTGSFGPKNGGTVAFADVALVEDLAFFAVEVDQNISLFAFDKAANEPLELEEVSFRSLPGIPVGALRDGLIAVAASETRVAVVWGTGMSLGSDDAVGGYAVFACTP